MPTRSMLRATLLLAAMTGLAGCRAKPWTALASPEESGGELRSFTAIVRYVGIEGGYYQLVDDGRAHYDPTNLPAQFQREGLRLEVVVQLRPDMASWHAAGPLVTIVRLRPLTDR